MKTTFSLLPRRAGVVSLGLISAALAVAACSSKEGPSNNEYDIAFPSIAVATATDYVVVQAFPVTANDSTRCSTLIQSELQGQLTEKPLSDQTFKVCDAASGKFSFSLDYGTYAFLGVGHLANNTETTIGCQIQTVGDGALPTALSLFPISKTYMPTTTKCASLTDFCSNANNCAH